MLEPYVSKGTRTVLRRGKESNFSPLSDDFLDGYRKELSFEEITEGSELVRDINFINPNFSIEQHINGNFKISYQSISFTNIFMAEAICVLITLNALIELKPAITLEDIEMEVNNFIETQRKKFLTG